MNMQGGSTFDIRNDNGEVIYMAGLLPDGTYGVVADESRPFTDEELVDADKFREHVADLSKRVDATMSNITTGVNSEGECQ